MRGHGRVAGRSVEDVFGVRGTSLPAPLIVPGAVLELHERVDSAGKVVVPLDEGRAADAVAAFIGDYQLDSVAVVFLWSFANPEHEQVVEKIARTVAPDVFVSLSSRVSPRLGEFERTVASVLNGYIGPEPGIHGDEISFWSPGSQPGGIARAVPPIAHDRAWAWSRLPGRRAIAIPAS
jgi:N-methylhydantoinase A